MQSYFQTKLALKLLGAIAAVIQGSGQPAGLFLQYAVVEVPPHADSYGTPAEVWQEPHGFFGELWTHRAPVAGAGCGVGLGAGGGGVGLEGNNPTNFSSSACDPLYLE